MASVSTHRQDNQAVYVLHTYPFKETSLVVELFARDFGRVATTAKGTAPTFCYARYAASVSTDASYLVW
jgi:recombinational DNA repair protein (RecF pathway)